jgi:RNA polymerase sigma-54 factor
MEIGLGIAPTTHQAMTAQMIEATQILALSTMELEQRVMTELETNPALEMVEAAHCPRCGTSLESSFCPACHLDQAAQTVERSREDEFEPILANGGIGEDEFDPMTLVASEVPLVERILSDVATMLAPHDVQVAEYILFNLDERGFLDASVADIAAELECAEARVERVLRVVQSVAPVGVAARDVRECLLLQLDHLAAQAERPIPAAVRPIVADHLDDLAAHRFRQIARALGQPVGVVVEALAFIRTELNPFPNQGQDLASWKTPRTSAYVAPDVIIYETEEGLQIEVVESRTARVRLDPLYASLAGEAGRDGRSASSDERSHIRRYVSQARFFLFAIQQRRETLRRITVALLELQRDFVLHGVRELRPLTRGMVAERVGVHESTVSRATANKYIMLPNRRVLPFSTFFAASLSVKDVIKELIEQEDKVLTDEEICQRLHREGIRIARRTVAKYRAALGILPSTYRLTNAVNA